MEGFLIPFDFSGCSPGTLFEVAYILGVTGRREHVRPILLAEPACFGGHLPFQTFLGTALAAPETDLRQWFANRGKFATYLNEFFILWCVSKVLFATLIVRALQQVPTLSFPLSVKHHFVAVLD